MRILVTAVLLILALVVLLFSYVLVVGIVSLLLKALFVLLAVGVISYFFCPSLATKISRLFQLDSAASPAEQTRLWSTSGQVRAFCAKPTLMQLTMQAQEDNERISLLLPNETAVSVLEDHGEVSKVRIKSGDNKGKVLWVGQDSILGKRKRLSAD